MTHVSLHIHMMRITLIGKIHASNIRVSALFGDKSWALPAWHSFVLSTVKNVGRFNAESAPAERFDGIHLDVEPYLLPGFNGPRHDEFLKDYLTMLSDVCDEAHRSHLTVGADIPFWYGEPDEFGYKDFIPQFKAEQYDPQEWANLFRQAGAQFVVGPIFDPGTIAKIQ